MKLSRSLIAAAAVGAVQLLTAGTAAAAEAQTPNIGGTVSSSGVGPLRWGASPAQVLAWAGKAEFSKPSLTTHPMPYIPGARFLGYHCRARAHDVCHTLFTFVDDRLVLFSTNSPAFHTARGAHAGMKASRARALDRRLRIPTGCPTWEGQQVPILGGMVVKTDIFTLYARSPEATTDFKLSC